VIVVVVGDVIADIAVRPAGPIARGTDTPSSIVVRQGGSAANVAVGVARLGGAVRFVGAVGSDAFGDLVVGELQRSGVETAITRSSRPTGTIVVLIDHDGERSFLTQRGACDDLEVDESVLDGARWLHVPAYCLSSAVTRASCSELLQTAHHRGIGSSIDCSSVSLIDAVGRDAFVGWLSGTGAMVVFANELESDALSLAERCDLGAMIKVIKRGAGPVTVINGDDVQNFDVEPIAKVSDTTGAGDVFAAGFLHATVHGHDSADSARAAIAAARSFLQHRK
jgi:sugar/nucleoside kinase (ribokinase family)